MELVQRIISCLFPSRCLLCRKTVDIQQTNPHIALCSSCESALPVNDYCCKRCALPLESIADNKSDLSVLCGRCISQLPEFDYAYSLFHYEAESITMVQQLKFAGKISYARTLSEMLTQKLQQEINKTSNQYSKTTDVKPDCLLPVPLHRSRLRQRGFNQSIEISREIAKKLNIPIEIKAITRIKHTAAQTGLNAKQRQKNIRDAFQLNHIINHKHVLIIDDVVTTGSTVNELAKLLKKNNVDTVGVLSVARAPLKN